MPKLIHQKSDRKFTKYVLNCNPSLDTKKDWPIESAEESGLLAAIPIPPSKDLRQEWWKIGNQGSTGSCVGWASADAVIRWHFVKADRIAEDDLLSVRYIWMAAKETDPFRSRPTTFIELDGTSLKAALDIARKFGVVLDRILPFGSGKLYPGRSAAFYAIAAQNRIASYFNLGTNPNNWRKWIAINGPVLTRLDVDITWDKATSNKGNLDEYHEKNTRGGHAIALVGYTPDFFIVRNSWGTDWGDSGFAYASNAYAAEAFTEAYGVVL